jgi:hypothetical protein
VDQLGPCGFQTQTGGRARTAGRTLTADFNVAGTPGRQGWNGVRTSVVGCSRRDDPGSHTHGSGRSNRASSDLNAWPMKFLTGTALFRPKQCHDQISDQDTCSPNERGTLVRTGESLKGPALPSDVGELKRALDTSLECWLAFPTACVESRFRRATGDVHAHGRFGGGDLLIR